MRFLIVGDLHGRLPKLHYKDFDAIIAPGDFCDDSKIKPYFFKHLRGSKKEWYEMVGRRKAKKFLWESFLGGKKVLKQLSSFGVPVFVIPGNWDNADVPVGFGLDKKARYKHLVKGFKNVKDCYFKMRKFKDFTIIGYGGTLSSSPEPDIMFERKAGKARVVVMVPTFKMLYSRLEKLFLKAKKLKKPIIFLSHNVPYRTKLDLVTWKKSPVYGKHYGSRVAKAIVKKFKPLICIGAHMHEHFGKTRLGKTACINTGYGPKVNTFLEIKKGKITKLEFWPKPYG